MSTVKLKSTWTKHTAHRAAGKRTLRLGALRSPQWPQNSKGLKATELKRVKNENKVKQVNNILKQCLPQILSYIPPVTKFKQGTFHRWSLLFLNTPPSLPKSPPPPPPPHPSCWWFPEARHSHVTEKGWDNHRAAVFSSLIFHGTISAMLCNCFCVRTMGQRQTMWSWPRSH